MVLVKLKRFSRSKEQLPEDIQSEPQPDSPNNNTDYTSSLDPQSAVLTSVIGQTLPPVPNLNLSNPNISVSPSPNHLPSLLSSVWVRERQRELLLIRPPSDLFSVQLQLPPYTPINCPDSLGFRVRLCRPNDVLISLSISFLPSDPDFSHGQTHGRIGRSRALSSGFYGEMGGTNESANEVFSSVFPSSEWKARWLRREGRSELTSPSTQTLEI